MELGSELVDLHLHFALAAVSSSDVGDGSVVGKAGALQADF